MARADALVGLVLVALAAALAWGTRGFRGDEGALVGPAFLPLVVSALLAVLGVVTIVKSRRSAPAAAPATFGHDRRAALRVVAMFASIALFLVLLDKAPMLGFPLLAPPLLFVLMLLFGARVGVRTALVAVLLAEGVYLSFVKWLGLLLPASAWF